MSLGKYVMPFTSTALRPTPHEEVAPEATGR
jgi:hypothetical protein